MRKLIALLLVFGARAAAAAPTVTISNPVAGATVEGPLPFSATATGGNRVSSVRFYLDGSLVATQSGPAARPTMSAWSFYAQVWDSRTVADGNHQLTVQASDASGATGSAQVVFTVGNGVVRPCVPPGQTASDADATLAETVSP